PLRPERQRRVDERAKTAGRDILRSAEGRVATRWADAAQSPAVCVNDEDTFVVRRHQTIRGKQREIVGDLEHDAPAIRCHAQAMKRSGYRSRYEPEARISDQVAGRLWQGLGEVQHGDRIAVAAPDLELLLVPALGAGARHPGERVHARAPSDTPARLEASPPCLPVEAHASSRRA